MTIPNDAVDGEVTAAAGTASTDITTTLNSPSPLQSTAVSASPTAAVLWLVHAANPK